MNETKEQEKIRMIKQYKYWYKPGGMMEVDGMLNTKNSTWLQPCAATFVLSYMRKVHGVCLLPSKD